MRSRRNPVLKLAHDVDDSRRRHGRVRCDQTRCTLGMVLDMSASGMRVLIKGRCDLRVDDTLPVTLELDGRVLSVTARVVWINRVAWRRHVGGLEFVQVQTDAVGGLAELAGIASNNEYIRDDLDPAARSA